MEDLASHLKAGRSNLREEQSKKMFQQLIAKKKKILFGIEDLDTAFLKKASGFGRSESKLIKADCRTRLL